jgi:hypothetical protein
MLRDADHHGRAAGRTGLGGRLTLVCRVPWLKETGSRLDRDNHRRQLLPIDRPSEVFKNALTLVPTAARHGAKL